MAVLTGPLLATAALALAACGSELVVEPSGVGGASSGSGQGGAGQGASGASGGGDSGSGAAAGA